MLINNIPVVMKKLPFTIKLNITFAILETTQGTFVSITSTLSIFSYWTTFKLTKDFYTNVYYGSNWVFIFYYVVITSIYVQDFKKYVFLVIVSGKF